MKPCRAVCIVLVSACLAFASCPAAFCGEEASVDCRDDLDCPPGYVCEKGGCIEEQGQCDPFAKEQEICPKTDLKDLEAQIESESKNSSSDTEWDF
ncbi:MAG: hypothetical protein ACLFSY_02190 [Desulfonatronovibrionaceae bacterium]